MNQLWGLIDSRWKKPRIEHRKGGLRDERDRRFPWVARVRGREQPACLLPIILPLAGRVQSGSHLSDLLDTHPTNFAPSAANTILDEAQKRVRSHLSWHVLEAHTERGVIGRALRPRDFRPVLHV